MRWFIATLFACLLIPASVEAAYVPYRTYGFEGDRYVVAQAGTTAADVIRAVRGRAGKARYLYPTKPKAAPASRRKPPRAIAPMTLARGLAAEVASAVGLPASLGSTRPSGCPPRAWCGCWLASHLGMANRSLWLARNWARVGSSAGGPQVGAIVVWRHHVGKITAVNGHRIRVLSGNDGRRVRDRWRTTAGVIAYRMRG